MNKKIVFTRREWVALAAALVLAALYAHVFGLLRMLDSRFTPGVGAALFGLGLLAVGDWYLGKNARRDAVSILLMAASALTALSCAIFSNQTLGALNIGACWLTGVLGLCRMADKDRWGLDRWLAVPYGIGQFFKAIFVNFDKPFRALGSAGGKNRGRALAILIGIAAAIPVLAIVIALLSSADAVFGGIFVSIGEWLESLNAPRAVWNVFRTVTYMLMLFSAFWYLAHPRPKAAAQEPARSGAPAAPFAIVIILLDIVYAVFVFIQVAFLFGGRETARMQGGFAEYARTGFFQLVAVAVINAAAVLASAVFMRRDKGGAVVRWAALLLAALTAVILVSAVWRMSLYINEYGLSMLRLGTLVGMALIAIGIVLATVKLWRPELKFFPVFFAVCLAAWIGFNYSNPARFIAGCNVTAYLDGRVATCDVDYLRELGPEAVAPLRLLAERSPENAERAEEAADYIVETAKQARWSEWRLFFSLAK